MGAMISGFQKNPFFGNASGRFGPPLNQQMVLVGRLDGPDPVTVRRMIDDALVAERYGLHGRAYFDARGVTDGGYAKGDAWIRGSYRAFRDAGYECEYDDRSELFEEDYPMSDVAIYAGWYAGEVTGPFRRSEFRFKTGAVAYHIHSFSAQSVRTRTAYWVGPLLARGAAATMGNVFEPYLAFTPQIDMFFMRLLEGAPFLEAGYSSQPVLSWQTTFVGDPLYRPFAVPLPEQIERLEAANRPDVEWAYLRRVNQLAANGEPGEAESLCRAKAEKLDSKVLYEKLGDLLRVTHREAAAIVAYQNAILEPRDASQFIRVATKTASAYEANKQPAQALSMYESLIKAYPTYSKVIEFYKQARELARGLGQDAKAKSLQAKIDELLNPPPPDAGKKK
jgi:tetratricopeptide (TPR) repeat protein